MFTEYCEPTSLHKNQSITAKSITRHTTPNSKQVGFCCCHCCVLATTKHGLSTDSEQSVLGVIVLVFEHISMLNLSVNRAKMT